jgi:hypothetical protein
MEANRAADETKLTFKLNRIPSVTYVTLTEHNATIQSKQMGHCVTGQGPVWGDPNRPCWFFDSRLAI